MQIRPALFSPRFRRPSAPVFLPGSAGSCKIARQPTGSTLPLIISHQHRFIFIHCRKTAGSSIAALLSKYLGPDDLHLGTWPEAYSQGVAPNRRAKLDLLNPFAAGSYLFRLARAPGAWFDRKHHVAALNGAQRLKYRRALGRSPEHTTAIRIRRFMPEAWEHYFKFCFVRNPYHRAVSDYRWRTKKRARTDISFLDFLKRMKTRNENDPVIPYRYDNWPMYTINNQIAVDYVGRFERLQTDLDSILKRIGLPPSPLPHEKKVNHRSDFGQWYGPAERNLVEQLFAAELEQFGYAFE